MSMTHVPGGDFDGHPLEQNLRDERDAMRRDGEKHASGVAGDEPMRPAAADADDFEPRPETD